MQWLIDLIKEWVIAQAYATVAWVQAQGYLTTGFVDRGDPAVKDYTLPNFTTDLTWRDLDLSAVVPEGAKAVCIRLGLTATVINAYFWLRKKGVVNEINMSISRTQSSNLQQDAEPTIALDENRHIQYKAKDVEWTVIDFIIKGWWL